MFFKKIDHFLKLGNSPLVDSTKNRKKIIATEQILKTKILIIDDEPYNVMVIEGTLKQGRHTFITSITDPIKINQFFETTDRILGETQFGVTKEGN